jgi:hypothetical protein
VIEGLGRNVSFEGIALAAQRAVNYKVGDTLLYNRRIVSQEL